MKRPPWIISLVVAGLLGSAPFARAGGAPDGAATAVAAEGAQGVQGAEGAAATAPHWVHTWTAMPQLTEPANMPPAPFTQDGRVLADATLRQTVHVSAGGPRIRLDLSNVFGGAPLPVTAVSVALPRDGRAGSAAIEPGSAHPLTFRGRASVTVPAGAQMVSDPLDLTVRPGANLTVTMYLAEGQASNDITSHPGSRTTSYLLAGDHTGDPDLPGAATADHWYFLSGVEVLGRSAAGAAVVLGDSLSDGRGSTTNANDRWPDQLLARLQAHGATAATAVLNEAAGGNQVLSNGLGPTALSRFDRDVLARSGVTSLVVFEGVNDIGTAPATASAQHTVAEDLVTAYDQMVLRAHAQGIRVYGATLTPFGGNTAYDDPDGYREAARQEVNHWIRTGGRFDAVVDLDRAARDPDLPRALRPAFDVGDHLHMNPTGYAALAGAFPLGLFA
ncbi:SGNH hydrolase [Streptomyces sulfonofaciens]|uniref:SGNH hydrolase n=1 Tax=Streptomyces sulfonofaciens TaxID=68272 RepID=A0A919G709_9ACTN|nr:SGNH/GDSL hydrolase family protein [Streptomyces sulfonofaciens]GHH78616.1 SGNH hydrolase [Streptomyces sulfonofaciens]